MMVYYGRQYFQTGPEYFLEYYQDSSMTTVAYIIYKKINPSHYELYYALRIKHSEKPPFYLGKETRGEARPGRTMPLFAYEIINKTTTLERNLFNAARAGNISMGSSGIASIMKWEFP